MRNPWGSEDYKGPFHDEDPQWTDAWRKEAGSVVANDGKFFIPLSDFKIAFNDYAINMYQTWNTSSIKGEGIGELFNYSGGG